MNTESRKEFEQAVERESPDDYGFDFHSDGYYCDEILDRLWWAWQDSRQALECEPAAYAVYWGHGEVELYESPLPVFGHEPDAVTPLYTHPASADNGKPLKPSEWLNKLMRWDVLLSDLQGQPIAKHRKLGLQDMQKDLARYRRYRVEKNVNDNSPEESNGQSVSVPDLMILDDEPEPESKESIAYVTGWNDCRQKVLEYTHPASADDWIKCSERQPLLGQRVILEKQGVVQICMPVFDVDCNGYFWDFEDVNGVDNPRVDYEKDCWTPLPLPPKEQTP